MLNQLWIPGINPPWSNVLLFIHIGCHLLNALFKILAPTVHEGEWSVIYLSYTVFIRFWYHDYANFITQVETTPFFDILECLCKIGIIYSLECLVELTDKTAGLEVLFIRDF